MITNEYRPIPFWSWNEKLDTEETARQVQLMHTAGIGGFFMHARGGLGTEYMGEEWFDNISAAKDEGKRLNMRAWAHDENGWPSGFGDGKVNGKGIEYQQKYLRMSDKEPVENVICKSSEHWFYYDVNPFYVDTLDKKVIAEFIKTAYEPYFERFGNDIEGFFTDEPQISREGIPWSFVFYDEYQKRYNDNLYSHLEELFLPLGDYKKTRIRFWKMVTDLFSEAFFKQIYTWCNERGLKLTGHLLLEEDLISQLTTNGACMPHYEYFNIPGMDWLGRNIYNCLTARQVSSVAEQLGKGAVISETFALCGHNVSFSQLKGIYEWQMVRGINLLCPHLEGYSLRGIRKRDYPPAMYYQQPWWSEYPKLIDGLSREGMILNRGHKTADVLLIHPQTTAWSMFDNGENEGIKELNSEFLNLVSELEKKHILFHLGDETIMERHARVDNGKIVIGKQSYGKVIISCCSGLLETTKKLIDEYKNQGGIICDVSDIPYNDIVESEDITYTKRIFDDYTVHYFVNSSNETKRVKINASGDRIDFYSGERLKFDGLYEFEPWGSLMLVDRGEKPKFSKNPTTTAVKLSDTFRLDKNTQNAFTLDRCDYYFDGVLQEENGYVLNICERANALKKKVKIHQVYHVDIAYVPDSVYLVCETPEKFDIKVNGKRVDCNIEGYFLDTSFKKLDIHNLLVEGRNEITFDCDFVQSDEFYKNLDKARIFESEKNKLSYDMEIEAVYLVGNFSVKTDGRWHSLSKNALRYSGGFVIDKLPGCISLNNIEQQGFPFFSGELSLVGEAVIDGKNPVLELNATGVNAVRIEVNGIEKTMLTDNKIPLSDCECGRQKIKLTLINNLRNLLGPHHLKEGESYSVGPSSFYKERCIWNGRAEDTWNDDYCFVEFGFSEDEWQMDR